MVFEVMSKLAFYATHVVKGLYDIVTDKEEFIYDKEGDVIAKLPSRRKKVLIFIKNFLKEPVSSLSLPQFDFKFNIYSQ